MAGGQAVAQEGGRFGQLGVGASVRAVAVTVRASAGAVRSRWATKASPRQLRRVARFLQRPARRGRGRHAPGARRPVGPDRRRQTAFGLAASFERAHLLLVGGDGRGDLAGAPLTAQPFQQSISTATKPTGVPRRMAGSSTVADAADVQVILMRAGQVGRRSVNRLLVVAVVVGHEILLKNAEEPPPRFRAVAWVEVGPRTRSATWGFSWRAAWSAWSCCPGSDLRRTAGGA